jgi:hypothetical protein
MDMKLSLSPYGKLIRESLRTKCWGEYWTNARVGWTTLHNVFCKFYSSPDTGVSNERESDGTRQSGKLEKWGMYTKFFNKET